MMVEMRVCRCCLSTEAEELSSRTSYDNILDILTGKRLEMAELWLCYVCSHVVRKISQFRGMCLRAEVTLKEYFSKNTDKRKKIDTDFFKQDKAILKSSKKPSRSNTLCMDIQTQRKISPIQILSIIHDSKPSKNYTDDMVCEIKVKLEPGLNFETEETNEFEEVLENLNGVAVKFGSSKLYTNGIDVGEEGCLVENRESHRVKRKVKKNAKNTLRSPNTFEPPENTPDLPNISEVEAISEVDEADAVLLTLDEQLKEKVDRSMEKSYIDSPFKCELCVLPFKVKHVLENHMKKHNESRGPFKCCVCFQHFPTETRLRSHRTRVHARHFACPMCGDHFWPRQSFRDHVAKHKGVVNSCPVCGKQYGRITHLRAHVRVTHGSGARYKCDTCGKMYDSRNKFEEHILRHSGKPSHVCSICHKVYFTAKILALHGNSHFPAAAHYCVECDRHFKSAMTLHAHLKYFSRHRDPALLKFPCGVCPKRYITTKERDAHVSAVHELRVTESCDTCGATYNNKKSLRSHVLKKHRGYKLPRKFACGMCDKSFTAKRILQNHVNIHTGAKPYECSICHDNFRQKAAMDTHVKLVHLKMKRLVKPKKSATENTPIENQEMSTVANTQEGQ